MVRSFNSISLPILSTILVFFAVSCSNNNSLTTEEANETITNTYQTLLNRDPDPDGLKHFTGLLKDGISLEEIENSIKNSEEFKNLQ